MADIFGRANPVYAAGFEKTDNQGVVIAGGDIHLVQDFSVQYGQAVYPLYEVGSLRVWFSAAPQTGTVSLNTVIGGVVEDSGKKVGVNDTLFTPNVCQPQTGSFAFDSCGGGGVFTCKGMVATSVTVTGQSQQGHTTLAVSYNFVGLER